MAYVERDITGKLKSYAEQFPVVFLTGPRQSGKSTLLEHVFPDYRRVNLEEKDLREFALDDPRGFLNGLGDHVVIDEAQYAPDVFSYIQTIVDARDEPGMYILSGSQNFLLLKSISQSLAGRVGVMSLLPFSFGEFATAGVSTEDTNELMFGGCYPRRVVRNMKPADFFSSYLRTYVERDVRFETGVQDLDKFISFMRVCAANVGNPINLSAIGTTVETDARTISSWLNILEESYLTFRLRPYARKVAPRYSKKPKLYFYDSGLLCALLGIKSASDLSRHGSRGVIFENMIVADYYKRVFNRGGFPGDNAYFWRDSSDREKEVDLLIESPDKVDLYEIKSVETAKGKFADNLFRFEKAAKGIECVKHVVYDGPHSFTRNGVKWMNRREFTD
jgi:predicted AAA+ superfamily ATPase